MKPAKKGANFLDTEQSLEMPEEDITKFGDRVFRQALDLWVTPEIERRRSAGLIHGDLRLNGFQVIMPSRREHAAENDFVRINEEVRIVLQVKALKDVDKGQLVRLGEVEPTGGMKLSEDEDPNAGHFTALNLGGQWQIGFDFRRDKAHVQSLLKLAREFYASAKLCIERNLLGPAVDDLHGAAELAAKAELLLFGSFAYEKPKDHGVLNSRYSEWARLGNAPTAGNTALSVLSRQRAAARHLEGRLNIKDLGGLCENVDTLITHVEEGLGETSYEQPEGKIGRTQ